VNDEKIGIAQKIGDNPGMKGPRKGIDEEEMSEYEDKILEENTC
jgi:hypothetical protein